MIGQCFDIAEYNWNVTVYYYVTKHDIGFCLKRLRKLTTKQTYHNECKKTLYTDKKDRAYIYTSYRKLESVIFIGIPSSTGELINTITHEANHLKAHIATYYNIDEKEEEVAYLIGDIVQQMTESFIRLIYFKPLHI